jgi:hypothetical protein
MEEYSSTQKLNKFTGRNTVLLLRDSIIDNILDCKDISGMFFIISIEYFQNRTRYLV